ncbi:MAG: hypothetical protein M0008_13205 [Actinomycetota bacterium]|nr:hypothetical protein [Actinomycetota bacterium]
MRNLLKPRTFVVAAVAMLLSGGAYAFTASNTVPTTTAGNGSATISGYTVSGVTYTLSNATPGTAASPVITKVSFNLAAKSCPTADPNVSDCTPNVVDAVITGATTTHDYSGCTTSATSGATSWAYVCVLSTVSGATDATVGGASSLAVTATDSNASTGSTL